MVSSLALFTEFCENQLSIFV